jgi:hypothetical protein
MRTSLYLDERTDLTRFRDLILGGVPCSRGELTGGGWFTLSDEGGRESLFEGSPVAFWPDGSVKWLHVCGMADLAGGRRNRFVLSPAPGVRQEGLTVWSGEDELRIRGGLLDVDISGDVHRLLRVRRRGDDNPLTCDPGLSAEMTVVDPDGSSRRRCGLRAAAGRPEAVVRSANRVVTRVPFRFEDEHGNCLAELILFIEVFRESPEVRLEPVWIYLGSPNRDLVESLTLTAHVPLDSERCSYGFSDERGPGCWDVIQRYKAAKPEDGHGPRWPQARLLQLGSSFYRTDKRTFAQDASWVKAVEGRRAQGWCHMTDGRTAVTAAMRYFWQEYPHAMGIDADAGTLSFGLIPAGAPPLDLRRYSQQVYGSVVYEAGKRGPFAIETHGACGIAKAHELMLRFHEPGDQDVAARAVFFVNPCRPLVPPCRFAESGVAGRLAPADSGESRHEQADSSTKMSRTREPAAQRVDGELAAIVEFIIAEREYRGWYGLMDFGDVQMDFRSEVDRWGFDDGGYAWLNTEGLPDQGLWLNALRAANPAWIEAAVEMSRHNRDVDVYHRGALRGTGTRHNVNHWGCPDKEWRVSMPLVRRFHYYLTADPWTAEVIRNTVAVYQSHERTSTTAPSMASALAGLAVKWEMNGDPGDGVVVRRLCDAFAAAIREDGQFAQMLHANLATGAGHPEGDQTMASHFFMNVFGGQHLLVDLAELLDHRALSAAIIRHADYWIRVGRTGWDVTLFLAHAFRATGERRYLEPIRRTVDRGAHVAFAEIGGDGLLDVPRHRIVAGLSRRTKMMCHVLGDPLQFLPYGLALVGQDT